MNTQELFTRTQVQRAIEDARERFTLAGQGLIDGLTRENEELRAALRFYACDPERCDCLAGMEDLDNVSCGYRARIALGPEPAEPTT